jgi:arginine/lysine/ornithine decarboxylase
MEILKERYHIQLEMAMESYAVAMTGMGDTEQMMDCLAKALLELDALYAGENASSQIIPHSELPQTRMTQAEAANYPWKLVSAKEGIGLVCAESIWAYPPGIPMIIPGEVVSEELICHLLRMSETGIRLCGTRGMPPETIAVLKLA